MRLSLLKFVKAAQIVTDVITYREKKNWKFTLQNWVFPHPLCCLFNKCSKACNFWCLSNVVVAHLQITVSGQRHRQSALIVGQIVSYLETSVCHYLVIRQWWCVACIGSDKSQRVQDLMVSLWKPPYSHGHWTVDNYPALQIKLAINPSGKYLRTPLLSAYVIRV